MISRIFQDQILSKKEKLYEQFIFYLYFIFKALHYFIQANVECTNTY